MAPQPVVLDTLGGLVSASRPEDLSEGASPRTNDTDFLVSRVIQRPGCQNVYSYQGGSFGPNGGGAAVDVDTQGNPWANPSHILADDGSFATVTVPPTAVLDVSTVQAYSTGGGLFHPFIVLVTFTSDVPAFYASQTYSFSGLTNYTLLNGTVLNPAPLAGLAANQAAFGNVPGAAAYGPYGPTSDTGTASVLTPNPDSDQLQVTGFSFALPSTASITGISVSVKGYSPDSALYAQLVQNGVVVGSSRSVILPTSNSFVTFGDQTDVWGATWTYSQIDSPNFGVSLWAETSGSATIFLDYCEITVYVTPSSADFTGLMDADLLNSDQVTLALDANGITWEEDVTNDPDILASASLIPSVPAGSYLKGIDAGGIAYMAYSNLEQGSWQPMQYNGQWCDRITQVGPGAPPSFAPSTEASTPLAISAYSFSSGILTLTYTGTEPTAGELVSFSGFTSGCAALNGQTFSILGTGLTTSQFEIATSLVSGSGSDTGTATPQYTYQIAASPNGITQPAQQSDPGDPGHLSVLLWSSGPGSQTAGNVVTVYYKSSWDYPTPDETLVNAFNAGYPVYVYIQNAAFGNGVWQVTSIGNALPPGVDHWRWYFTVQIPTSGYQLEIESSGTYQITQATLTTLTPVPGLSAGQQISLSGNGVSSWNNVFTVVAGLNSGSYSISQTQLTGGVATYSWNLISGVAPAAGQLVTVTGTLNAGGTLNVTDALITSASGAVSGTFTVGGFETTVNYGVQVETGQATTAGTQFLIDPGAALVGNTTQSPIYGNSGGGTLTVVGGFIGGTFPIGAGTRQGVVFFITRNGAVTCPSPPATFTVNTGANYITASNIPIGPPNVVARGIAFTEAGQNGVPGANFYTYDTAQIFTVSNVVFTASALIIPDNLTTTYKFTFSDAVLLASEEIDIEGNNYFNLMELGNPVWMFQYAGRMMYGLCQTKIQNLLNMSFDGGYLPSGSSSLPMPLGWSAASTGNVAQYSITAFAISSNIATFTCANSLQPGYEIVIDGLSVGTYFNGLQFTVASANGTQFTVAFSHGNVSTTSDSGTVFIAQSSLGLVTSPVFGDCFQIQNLGSSTWNNFAIILFQSAYQDAYNVNILQPNTAYSVRLVGRSLGADGQEVSVRLLTYSNGVFGSINYGTATFILNQGAMTLQTSNLTSLSGIPTIPTTLVLAVGIISIGVGDAVQIDRIEVFPTFRPVDTTTVWTSYSSVDGLGFEAVDRVTGSLGCGLDNPQATQGAYTLLEQLYVEKSGSTCVTQDSPNYEPNNWTVKTIKGAGTAGPNAFHEQEEFALKANRKGVYFFQGGKAEPISRELQAIGVNGSVWETINWSAGSTIWLRNDMQNRRFLAGVPMNLPNFWLPNAAASTPTGPNVILMCNYSGCPSAEELENAAPVHTTMFGDVKALDMRRKWSIWQIPCPAAEFIARPDTFTEQLFLGNGINSSKIYQLVNGAASGGQNTDDGAAINWLYTTYGLTGEKQGQQNPMLGALRKVWTYFATRLQGIGNVACKLYINTLDATPITLPLQFTLAQPALNHQERVIEVAGQKVFVEYSAATPGGYAEISSVILDGEADPWWPHRGVSS